MHAAGIHKARDTSFQKEICATHSIEWLKFSDYYYNLSLIFPRGKSNKENERKYRNTK